MTATLAEFVSPLKLGGARTVFLFIKLPTRELPPSDNTKSREHEYEGIS